MSRLLVALLFAGTPMTPLQTLQDSTAPVPKRVEAARALAGAKDEASYEALAAVMELTAEELRDVARDSLRKGGGTAFFARRVVDPAASAEQRRKAADALRHLKDMKTVPALAQALADPEAKVRAGAAHALAVFGAGAAVEPLEKALQDPAADVRYFAAIALARISKADAGAKSTLQRRLAVEADEGVKAEIEKALK